MTSSRHGSRNGNPLVIVTEKSTEGEGWIWGNNRGGGGAPLRDDSGSHIANLRNVIRTNPEIDESQLTSPMKQNLPLISNNVPSPNRFDLRGSNIGEMSDKEIKIRKEMEYRTALKEQIEANKRRQQQEKQEADELKKIDLQSYLLSTSTTSKSYRNCDAPKLSDKLDFLPPDNVKNKYVEEVDSRNNSRIDDAVKQAAVTAEASPPLKDYDELSVLCQRLLSEQEILRQQVEQQALVINELQGQGSVNKYGQQGNARSSKKDNQKGKPAAAAAIANGQGGAAVQDDHLRSQSVHHNRISRRDASNKIDEKKPRIAGSNGSSVSGHRRPVSVGNVNGHSEPLDSVDEVEEAGRNAKIRNSARARAAAKRDEPRETLVQKLPGRKSGISRGVGGAPPKQEKERERETRNPTEERKRGFSNNANQQSVIAGVGSKTPTHASASPAPSRDPSSTPTSKAPPRSRSPAAASSGAASPSHHVDFPPRELYNVVDGIHKSLHQTRSSPSIGLSGFARLQLAAGGGSHIPPPLLLSENESLKLDQRRHTAAECTSRELRGESEHLYINANEVDVISEDQLDRLLMQARSIRGKR